MTMTTQVEQWLRLTAHRMTVCGFALVILLTFSTVPMPALACTIQSFTCITNDSGICEDLASQLKLSWSMSSSEKVRFLLSNTGPLQSSIANLYWDDSGDLLGSINWLQGSSGVKWLAGGSPGSLPAGTEAGFDTDPMLTSSAKVPRPKYGINPGEWLTIEFALNGEVSRQEIQAALLDGSLRAGIHVISAGNQGQYSESLVTKVFGGPHTPGGEGYPMHPNADIPEPPARVLAFGGLMLFVLGNLCRGRFRKRGGFALR